VQVKNGGTTLATYVYDANGNRVSQTESSTTADFYYSRVGQDLEDRVSGTVTDQYVWGLAYVNQLVVRDDNSSSGSYGKSSSGLGRRIYVQQDADFNVTALTDTSGNVLQRFVYTPYGVMTVIGSTSAWSTTTDSYSWVYTFQGGRYDATTGMIHFGAREYSPTLARWVQQDPLGYVDGSSLYEAFREAPLKFLDPSGLCVHLIFNMKDGTLTAIDGNQKLVLKGVFSGNGKNINDPDKGWVPNFGPTPLGQYYLGPTEDHGDHKNLADPTHTNKQAHPNGNFMWYPLFGRDADGNWSTTGVVVRDPATRTPHTRDDMFLHPGSVSDGCVTVPSDEPNTKGNPNYPNSAQYDALRKMIDNTKGDCPCKNAKWTTKAGMKGELLVTYQ